MGSSSDKSFSARGLAAALALYPALPRQVEELYKLDEDFRGLCEDLADAEVALKGCQQLPSDIRDERKLEYEELVASLSNEIGQVLSRSNVIPLRPPRS